MSKIIPRDTFIGREKLRRDFLTQCTSPHTAMGGRETFCATIKQNELLHVTARIVNKTRLN